MVATLLPQLLACAGKLVARACCRNVFLLHFYFFGAPSLVGARAVHRRDWDGGANGGALVSLVGCLVCGAAAGCVERCTRVRWKTRGGARLLPNVFLFFFCRVRARACSRRCAPGVASRVRRALQAGCADVGRTRPRCGDSALTAAQRGRRAGASRKQNLH